MASIAKTWWSRAVRMISSAPATVAANVFSISTAFPALIAASAGWRCCGCGVAM